MRVLIDGVPVEEHEAVISVFDWGVMRGFGVFEVVRCYGSVPFRLDAHLDRLERSATALGVAMPDRGLLRRWIGELTESQGQGHVRVILTGGGRDESVDARPRAIVMWEPPPELPAAFRLLPIAAPWHPGTDSGGFPGVKWTSYAPNMASTDKAQRAGFDDALLIGSNGIVLEGPTFTVAWVHDGRIETPSLDAGILQSITRDVMIECADRLGIPVSQGHFPLDRLLGSDEAFALSTLKQVMPIEGVGEVDIELGPVTSKLAGSFEELVRIETAE
jgi:branched-subunit amino acid aminotransferase/4-amino-4-deoxychorismate lyase